MATIASPEQLGEGQKFNPGTGVATYEPPNWRTLGLAGQLVEKTGGEVEQAAQVMGQLNARQDDYVAQDAANKLRAAAVGLQVDPDTGFENKRGGEVVGPQFRDNYMQQYQDKQQEIASTLTTDQQRKTFALHSAVIANQFQSNLLQHQAKATFDFNNEVNQTAIGTATKDAIAHPFDDENGNNTTRDTSFGLIENAFTNMAHDQGITGAAGVQWVANKMAIAKQQIVNQQIQAVLDNNQPMQAQRMYANAVSRGDLLPGDPIGAKVQAHANQAQTAGVAPVLASTFVQSRLHDGGPIPNNVYPNGNVPADGVAPYSAAHMTNAVAYMGKPSPYDDLFKQMGQKYNVDPTLLKAISFMESSGNKDAMSTFTDQKTGQVKHAWGLMQINQDNFARLGIKDSDDARDPAKSIEAAAHLLQQGGFTSGSDYVDAAKFYHGGPASGGQQGVKTQQYGENMRAISAVLHGGVKPSNSNPTADDLEGMTGDLRTWAQQQVKDPSLGHQLDFEWQKQTVDATMAQHEQNIKALRGQESQNASTVFSAMVNPDASQNAHSPTDLNPQQRAAYDALPPEKQHALLSMMRENANRPNPETDENDKAFHEWYGKAVNPNTTMEFLKTFNPSVMSTWTPEQRREMNGIWNKTDKSSFIGANVEAALKDPSVDMLLKSSGLRPTAAQPLTDKMAHDYNGFYGEYARQLNQYIETNGHPPDGPTQVKVAQGLAAKYTFDSGSMFKSNPTARGFEMEGPGGALDKNKNMPLKLTPQDTTKYTELFQNRYDRRPLPDELQMMAVGMSLHPNDKAYWDLVDAKFKQNSLDIKAGRTPTGGGQAPPPQPVPGLPNTNARLGTFSRASQ